MPTKTKRDLSKHDHSQSSLNERLFVCNISQTTHHRELEALFKTYGSIKDFSFSPGLGYAFVEFREIEAANVCRLSKLYIDGRTLRIDLPTPRKNSDSSSSRGGSSVSSSKTRTPVGPSPLPSRRSSHHETMIPSASNDWPALPTITPSRSTRLVDDSGKFTPPSHSSISSSQGSSSSNNSKVSPRLTPSIKSDSTTSTFSDKGSSLSSFGPATLFQSSDSTSHISSTSPYLFDDITLPIWTSAPVLSVSVSSSDDASGRATLYTKAAPLTTATPINSTPSTQVTSHGRDWIAFQRQQHLLLSSSPVLLQAEDTQTSSNVDTLRIFAGKLSSKTTTSILTSYIVDFLIEQGLEEDPRNHVADVFMPLDIYGKPRGFAFITFQSQVAFDAVLKFTPHILDGKEIVIDAAAPRGIKVRTDLPGRPWEGIPEMGPSSITGSESNHLSANAYVSSAFGNSQSLETISNTLFGALCDSFGIPQSDPRASSTPILHPFHLLQMMQPIIPFTPQFIQQMHLHDPLQVPSITLRPDAASFIPTLVDETVTHPREETSSSPASIFVTLRNGKGSEDNSNENGMMVSSTLQTVPMGLTMGLPTGLSMGVPMGLSTGLPTGTSTSDLANLLQSIGVGLSEKEEEDEIKLS